MSKARAYCFTVNNWTESDVAAVQALAIDAQYVIYGKEVGDAGTPHLQGYVYYKNARSFKSVKKGLPRAHIEVARGCPQSNIAYCSKQGDVWSSGEPPRQGERTDIDVVRDEMKAGANMRRVVDVAPSYQAIKIAEVWLKYNESARNFKPEIRWFYGSTGAGKTRAARAWLGDVDVYTCMNTGRWFDGYDGHKNLLVDDFRKDFCKFADFLKFLDRYEYRVETKGGTRQLLATKMAITCPYHPRDVYKNREDVEQLIRRIEEDEHGVRHPDRIILVGTEVALYGEDEDDAVDL